MQTTYQVHVAFFTILVKETRRFIRIWPQTLVPPAVTMALYFVIFGRVIGSRIGTMAGFDYTTFVVPGLVMMSVIMNSYNNVASSFYSGKFQRSVEEMLVAPVPDWVILAGFVCGGVVRGLLTGLIVLLMSRLFVNFEVYSPFFTFLAVFLTALVFSLGGFINGLWARRFDDISIVPTFVLTPLTYLGGVFYSVKVLPPFWQGLSHINPVFYQVSAFRYGLLGYSDVTSQLVAFFVMAFIAVALIVFALYLLKKGKGLRS